MKKKSNSNRIAVGCDIVNLNRFKKAVTSDGQNFLNRVFTLAELENSDFKHLAGIFTAKEAAIKALKLKPGSWLDFEIIYQKNGKPEIKFGKKIRAKIETSDLSISHDGDYATSIFVAILK
jgi:phosphopantetheine--protein transferase-like protein